MTNADHERTTRAVVDEVFADALASGLVMLNVDRPESSAGPPMLRITPSNPAAAQVEVGADTDATYVVVGAHQLQVELWGSLPEERIDELRACLEAVRDGRVEAAVERHWSGPRSMLAFHAHPRSWISRGYCVAVDEDQPYWSETYEPY